MEMMLWNAVLSFVLAALGFVFKSKMDELKRLSEMLSQTREEIAAKHITRAEFEDKVEKSVARFDACFKRLETKIDDLAKQNFQSK